jgi:hypothetical protein
VLLAFVYKPTAQNVTSSNLTISMHFQRTVVMHGLRVWLAVWHQVVEQQDRGTNDFRTKHASKSLGW